MDGLEWKRPWRLMIWGYPYFRTPPNEERLSVPVNPKIIRGRLGFIKDGPKEKNGRESFLKWPICVDLCWNHITYKAIPWKAYHCLRANDNKYTSQAHDVQACQCGQIWPFYSGFVFWKYGPWKKKSTDSWSFERYLKCLQIHRRYFHHSIITKSCALCLQDGMSDPERWHSSVIPSVKRRIAASLQVGFGRTRSYLRRLQWSSSSILAQTFGQGKEAADSRWCGCAAKKKNVRDTIYTQNRHGFYNISIENHEFPQNDQVILLYLQHPRLCRATGWRSSSQAPKIAALVVDLSVLLRFL